MNYFLNRYKFYMGLIIGAFLSAIWGLWQGLPLWQMLPLIFTALVILLCRILLDRIISGFQVRQVRKWCQANHWTDLIIQDKQFYAFPPNAVIPLPIALDETREPKEAGRIELWRTIQTSLMSLIPPIILVSLFLVVVEIVTVLGFLILKIAFQVAL